MSWSSKVLAIRDRFKKDENRILICEEIEKILKYAEEFDRENIVTAAIGYGERNSGRDSGIGQRSQATEAGVSAGAASTNGREGCETGADGVQQWLPF